MRTYLIAAALAATLVAGTAEAQTPAKSGRVVYVTVDAEDWATCQAEGGCDLYSQEALRELVREAAELAVKRARLHCGRGA